MDYILDFMSMGAKAWGRRANDYGYFKNQVQKSMKFSLSAVSPCQNDPVEILPLAMGPFVSELQVFSYKKV